MDWLSTSQIPEFSLYYDRCTIDFFKYLADIHLIYCGEQYVLLVFLILQSIGTLVSDHSAVYKSGLDVYALP